MIGKFLSLLRKVLAKPAGVVFFRCAQELYLLWLLHSRGWMRINRRAQSLYGSQEHTVVLKPKRPEPSNEQLKALREYANQVICSDIKIFGSKVPDLEIINFSEDWRFGHTWPAQYFKRYSFYEKKITPYDIKFPWELSRFGFLVPLLCQQLIDEPDIHRLQWIEQLLSRWEEENPLAHSVNWYPMEASMRTVSLVLLLDLLRLNRSRSVIPAIDKALQRLIKIVSRLVFKNAIFVWHTREYTDVRGNHFAANIVALYLAGRALSHEISESKKWRRYSRMRLEQEISLQFCADGVNFEKACGYHKLVLELFSLAGLAAEYASESFSNETLELLEKAALFSDAITRPDGLAANFGDTDDASAIPFAFVSLRSHGAIVSLVRAWLRKPIGAMCFQESEELAALFLTGRKPSEPIFEQKAEHFKFAAGGFYIVRKQNTGFFFMADLGEVGMNGRGGHGHNDFLSFELFIDSHPIVLDSGCSGYTADLDKKSLYRGTAAHATVQLFGEEIADLLSPWVISAHALPRGVKYEYTPAAITLSGYHDGYSRIIPGSRVCRRFTIMPARQAVYITDSLSVPANIGSAYWHFPTALAETFTEGKKATIGPVTMRSNLVLSSGETLYSAGYGHEQVGNVITSQALLLGGTQHFTFEFCKKSKELRL